MIVDADDGAGEGGDLSEGDEDCFVDLTLRREDGAEEEKRDAGKGEDGGYQELYELCVFHLRFLKSGAKVVQKNEATKKVTSPRAENCFLENSDVLTERICVA